MLAANPAMRPRSKRLPFEELIIYTLLIVIGAIPITNAVEAGATIGVEATIGLLMIVAGCAGLLAFIWQLRGDKPVAPPEARVQLDPGASDPETGSRNR